MAREFVLHDGEKFCILWNADSDHISARSKIAPFGRFWVQFHGERIIKLREIIVSIGDLDTDSSLVKKQEVVKRLVSRGHLTVEE